MKLKSVLTVAGSDSSGGAGIQADLKTISAHGLFGQSVITALTAQNTCGVLGVSEVVPEFVSLQFEAVFSDIVPDAVKVGMVSSGPVADAIAGSLAKFGAANVVVDPVMVATSGARLMGGGTLDALVGKLFPLACLVTPNLPEASVLAGFDVAAAGVDGMKEAASRIATLTRGAVLVKGGHLEGESSSIDVLLLPGRDTPTVLKGRYVQTSGTHGTGCTLSSAIASRLALGADLPSAVVAAKDYLSACLSAGLQIGRGNGPLDHMAPLRSAGGLSC